mmetsp:Transcript_42909/g.49757  ORF Transcript_42909/g.49757 Transcript_42909/m.49757 type:complete len:194 (+) Transcript_42909:41-622(+)
MVSFPVIFADYGSYHSNTVNRIIHILFAPLILTTILAIIMNYSPHIDIDMGKTLEFNYAMVFVLLVSVMYLYMDFLSGLLSSTLYIGITLLLTRVYHELIDTPHYETYFRGVLIVHGLAWAAQIVGHLVFEKRAPQSHPIHTVYSILAAPHLSMIDLLCALGYKPKARREAQMIIDKNIAEFKIAEAKKKKAN